MSDPFRNASSGSRISEFLGEDLLCKPIELHTGVKTRIGESDAMETDIAILNADGTETIEYGVLIFQKVLVSDLKRRVGDAKAPLVLGRLGQKPNKTDPDGRPTWIFEQVEADVMDHARRFVADNPEWGVPAEQRVQEPVRQQARQAPVRQQVRQAPVQEDGPWDSSDGGWSSDSADEPPF